MSYESPLTHLSLFSGIGGIDLAAEWAGFRSVGFCEQNSFCQQVLNKHWPDVPIWGDVRDVTKESFVERTGLQSVNLVSGGFPCQPISIAGKRRGKDDDRWLWPEMLRVIQELKPTWVLGENVANLVNMGIEENLSDLASIGYQGGVFLIPACAVEAFHRRDRVFIVAHTKSKLREASEVQPKINNKGSCETPTEWRDFFVQHSGANNFVFRQEDESRLCRDDDGVPSDVDRLRALGNAVVPEQIYPVLAGIAEIERRPNP